MKTSAQAFEYLTKKAVDKVIERFKEKGMLGLIGPRELQLIELTVGITIETVVLDAVGKEAPAVIESRLPPDHFAE